MKHSPLKRRLIAVGLVGLSHRPIWQIVSNRREGRQTMFLNCKRAAAIFASAMGLAIISMPAQTQSSDPVSAPDSGDPHAAQVPTHDQLARIERARHKVA